MSVTIATCLFDLGKREGNPNRKSVNHYLRMAERWRDAFGLFDHNIVIFCDPELAELLPHSLPTVLEDLPSWKELGRIQKARETHPFYHRNQIKDTPLYGAFQRCKIDLLKRASEMATTSHVAWIDLGIAENVPLQGAGDALRAVGRLEEVQLLIHRDPKRVEDWRQIRQNVSGGFLAGPQKKVIEFCQLLDTMHDAILLDGFAPHDETVLEHVAAVYPEAIGQHRIASHQEIFTSFLPKPEKLLGLTMIVKDEAHGILKTLESVRPYVDRWAILDTGSTDGTQEIIRQAMADVPGELYEEPFVDFSTSRNRALELLGTETEFVLMPDSEDVLVGGERLRGFLEKFGGLEAYYVTIQRGALTYVLPLVSKTAARWRYVGRVHELLQKPGAMPPTETIPGVVLEQHATEKSVEATKQRWERDVTFLEEDAREDPTNPRTAFYLAQTYECLGRYEDAIARFQLRIKLGGWKDETFMAHLRRGRMMQRAGRPWPETQQAFLEAHLFDPGRAEPLYEIAKHYHSKDQHALTFPFARRAAEMPPSSSNLFVEREVSEWQAADLAAIAAFYIDEPGVKREGAKMAEKALKARPDDHRLRQNRAFYAPSALEMFGGVSRRIGYEPKEPYVATNPSVHFDGTRWRCVVRTTNYRIVNGHYLTPDDNVIFTKNVMLELDADLAVVGQFPMIDLDPTDRTDYPVHGYEDCRLFTVQGKPYCTATVCDFSTEERGAREIVLLELNERYEVVKATPIRGRWSHRPQKNWMPISDQSNEWEILYSLQPTSILRLMIDDTFQLEGSVGSNEHLRGGSQIVAVGTGFLCITHDVSFTCQGHRTYLHRFVWLDERLNVVAMTGPFYLLKRGIEFAAGMAVDGDRLVVSFGVDDCKAYFGSFSLSQVMVRLRTDFVV